MKMGNVFHKEYYTAAWKVHGPLGILKQIRSDLLFCWQRITRGYCDRDTGEIDAWFLSIMPDMLDCLRDNYIDTPLFKDSIQGQIEWADALTEMSRLFRDAYEDTSSRQNTYDEFPTDYNSIYYEERQTKHWDLYLDEQRKIEQYREKCKDQAFDLFKEWFPHLWH